MEKIKELQAEIKEWSDATFGKHRTATPITYHLKKEVDELIEKLNESYGGHYGSIEDYNKAIEELKMEYADCFMLLLDSISHYPFTLEEIYEATKKKLEINKKREWGKQDENGVVEHIRV